LLATISEQVEKSTEFRRPCIISEPIYPENKSTLYTSCSYDGITGEKLISSLSVLPQVDQLPNMFTYVSLQRNFLVRLFEEKTFFRHIFSFSVIQLPISRMSFWMKTMKM
jgi:hypothetical protein